VGGWVGGWGEDVGPAR